MENNSHFVLSLPIGTAIVFVFLLVIVLIAFVYRKHLQTRRVHHESELSLMKQKIDALAKEENPTFTVISERREILVKSREVYFVRSLGNYIEIHCVNGKSVIREKLSNFVNIVPDPAAYLRVHRSCIVRIDQIIEKGTDAIKVNNEMIKVGEKYKNAVAKIKL